MNWLVRTKLVLNPANISLFVKAHRAFRPDPDYSFFNLLRALWKVSRHERIVEHEGRYVHSSFLPPIPSRAAERVLEAVAGEGSVFSDHANSRRRAPISMYVAVTHRCNYECGHCSVEGRGRTAEWTGEELSRLFAELQDMGTAIIGLTGGEPMLRDDLPELIARIDDRSEVFLFTSGQNMTAERARQLKRAGLFAVGVSLDSRSAVEMDSLRGSRGAHERATKAVDRCLKAGLYTMIQTVAWPGRLARGDLEATVRYAASTGAHEVRILEPMPTGRLAGSGPDEMLGFEEREALKGFHVRMNREPGMPKVSVFAHTEDHGNYGCGAGTQHAYIDGGGRLHPCDFVPLAFGSVREESVATLWRRMHRCVGRPRLQCMAVELNKKGLLVGRTRFPLSPAETSTCLEALGQHNAMPGFYRALNGHRSCPAVREHPGDPNRCNR